jgi:hypothetical protein
MVLKLANRFIDEFISGQEGHKVEYRVDIGTWKGNGPKLVARKIPEDGRCINYRLNHGALTEIKGESIKYNY